MSTKKCYDGLNEVLSRIEDADTQQFMREALDELLPEESIVANMSADVAQKTISSAISQAQAKVIRKKISQAIQVERLTPMMDAAEAKDLPFMLLNTIEPQQAGIGAATQAKGSFGDAIAPKVATADKLALNRMDEALEGIDVMVEGKSVRAIDALMQDKDFGWAVAKIMNNAPDAAQAAAPYGEAAKFTAQAMTRMMDEYHTELLGRGILSGEVENYFPQIHSSYSVSHPTVGAEWREFMLEALDETYHGTVDENTVNYIARDILRGAPEDMMELGGPSELRLVHIKPEYQVEYLQRFAGKSAGQILMDKMVRSEKRLALSQPLGPDYKSNFTWAVSEIEKRLADPASTMTMAEREAARAALERAQLVWKGTIGAYTGNINLTAFTAATARLSFSAAKLGLTARYVVQDAVFAGLRDATLHRRGFAGFFGTATRVAANFFREVPTEQLPRHLRAIREAEALSHMMTMERMIGDTLAGVDIGNVNLSGATPKELAQFTRAHDRMLKARKINQSVLKYGLAERATRASVESNVAVTLAHMSRLATENLADVAKKESHFHSVMQAYGVERYWRDIQGSLDSMGNIDLDMIANKDARRAVLAMAYSEAEHMVGRPDMYTRSLIRKRGKAGTFSGELYLSATTFLATRRMIFDKVYANAVRRGAPTTAAYMAGGLAAAAVTVQLQQQLSARPTYEVWGDEGLNMEFAGRVLDESGMLYLAGPFMSGISSGIQRGSRSDASKIIGEQFGMVGAMVADTVDMTDTIFSDYAKYGEVRDASYRRMLDTAKGYIPGQNILPFAGVLNQAWLQVLDEVDPAYETQRYRNYYKSGRNMEGISGKMAEGIFD